MYEYWSDLGIIVLKILSDSHLIGGLMKLQLLEPMPHRETVNVFLYNISKYDQFPFSATTYRENIMRKGFYIGHHFGAPVKIKIINKNEIHLCAKDYNRILWSYITKFVLTIFCIEKNYIHLKAGAVSYNNKVIMFVGRGGSGKTEIIKRLCSDGAYYITNTHAIIDNNRLLGIDSNIRIRENKSDIYVNSHFLCQEKYQLIWQKIDYVIWCKYRNDNIINIEPLETGIMFENMRQYSEAIVNWELHEDIYDFYDSDPQIIGEKIKNINSGLYDLLSLAKKYYVNLDILHDKGFFAFQDLVTSQNFI